MSKSYTRLTPEEIPSVVVQTAKEEFKERGLTGTEMKTIAEKTGIGRATLYRYFSSIEPIAYLVATDYMESLTKILKSYLDEHKNDFSDGLSLVKQMKIVQANSWIENTDMQKFFFQFDSLFPPPYPDTPEGEEYARSIAVQHEVDMQALKIGIEDGSIRTDIDIYSAYQTLSEALIGYIQRGEILHHYQETLASANFLIDIFIDAIKARK